MISLESDVLHMTSSILSIIIDCILDRAFFIPFFQLFFRFLNLNSSETRNDFKKPEMAILFTLTLSGPGFEKLAQTGGGGGFRPFLTPLPCIRTKPNLV